MDTQSSEVTDDVHTKLLFPFFFREKSSKGENWDSGGFGILPGRIFQYFGTDHMKNN